MDCTHLRQAVKALAEIEQAGLLSDLKLDLAAEQRHGPKSDLKRYEHHRPYIKFIAREAADLLGEPVWRCEQAAREEFLPVTRRKRVINLLNRYARRLRGDR